MLDLEKLLKIPGVDTEFGFEISPDGRFVAFSWNISGQWEIYLLPLDHSAPPQCITQEPGAKFAPYWSPDGTKIAYVLDLDGGENYDIWLYHISSGKHVNLTPDTSHAIQPEVSWSPDGQELVFASDVGGKFEAYRLSLSDHAIKKLCELPFPVRNIKWSPSGKLIAVVTHATTQDYFTYLVSAITGDFYPISIENVPICAKDIAWSSSGEKLAFSSNRTSSYQIGIFHVHDRSITWISDNNNENEHPAWSTDDSQIVYISQDGPDTELIVQAAADKKKSKHFQIEKGVHYLPAFTLDGKSILMAFDNPSHPADLWLIPVSEGIPCQLTHSLPEEFDKSSFTLPEHIHYNSFDGTRVPAILYLPRNIHGPCPAVIYIHGGPNWLTQFTWDPLVQHMVSRGWVVLAPNYRGSTGYGKAWQTANIFELGRIDTADVAAAVEYLISNHIAKPDRIAVTGRSHGGYLTMTCLTQYPELWAGGSAVVPFLNWFTSHQNSRPDLQHWDRENFGDPVKNKALYYERSPYFFLDRIKAPVQLICGANDPRCPASESIQAQEALQKLGKPCDLVLYPDEGHVFLKIENVVDAKRRQVDFLASLLDN